MTTETIMQSLEITVALGALAFAIYEHKKRQRLEKTLKTITQAYPGDVAKIHQSCKWALTNVRDAHNEMAKIPDSPEKQKILKFINQATGDAAASTRMCSNLFNNLLSSQEAQFGTRNISHPERRDLELCKLEEENSN